MPTRYTNPVGGITGIGDPFVLAHEGVYYLYATSAPNGFRVWRSDNLVDWEPQGMALTAGGRGNDFGVDSFWAPEVIFYAGRFYMVYSARDKDKSLKIALAASDDPLGPFQNVKAPLFERPLSYIDGHIFVDDGVPYLFYAKDCSENVIDGVHTSQIYVQRMREDLLGLEGEPVLALEPDQGWEGLDEAWRWNEGPFVLKENGIYFLMYSANCYASPAYGVGFATAASPLGPWRKYERNPILAARLDIGVSGPGHNSVARSPDGKERFIIYHTHTAPQKPSGDRTVNIDRLYVAGDVLRVEGPTRTPQPYPSGAR